MLNWLMNKVRSGRSSQPVTYDRDQHPISRRDISKNALKVLYRLQSSGFDAYLVGGGVRDLLLDLKPKDFDIATDATPEQVRKLFRNSRIIGRRFKIVHVRFGPEIIEVTTFRGDHDQGDDKTSKRNDAGMLIRDNVYGDVEQDAIRRDFTINALYYTTEDFSVRDYVGGVRDLDEGVVRIIGDAETRYREDPVRMIRAIRFAAKLQFKIEKKTAAAIHTCRPLLTDVSSARMFEEVNKLFISGYGERTFDLMREYKLFELLFPDAEAIIKNDPVAETFIRITLRNTDARVHADKPVTPAFLYASLLWPTFKAKVDANKGMPIFEAIRIASNETFDQQIRHTAIPRRFSAIIRDIWEAQWRLPNRAGKRAAVLMEQRVFRAAYDFLINREAAGEDLLGLGKWWTRYQSASAEQREEMSSRIDPPKRKRKRSPRRKPSNRKPKQGE